MSVNKVIVLFCNKTTILLKFERKLCMRCICIVVLHDDAKGELYSIIASEMLHGYRRLYQSADRSADRQ